ncbi:sensor histidine kinase [Phenylobacterium sp.]|uniref:sensor histidine kinase n=1 Tax=Phenylobacterium sp. TaxID=1871053 RepID=UPI0035B139B1
MSAVAISFQAALAQAIGPAAAILLVGLLIASAFGLVPALLAIAAGALTSLALGVVLLPGGPLSAQGAFLALAGLGVLLCGMSADIARRRRAAAAARAGLAEARRPGPAAASLSDFLIRTDRATAAFGARAPGQEIERLLASLSVISAAWASVWLLNGALGATPSLLVLLGATLLVGGVAGARFGLLAGLLTVLAMGLAPAEIGAKLAPSALDKALLIAAFGASGLGVGLIADRLHQARGDLDRMTKAIGDLLGARDDRAIAAKLVEHLRAPDREGLAVLDPSGAVLARAAGDVPPADAQARERDGWRSAELAWDGRAMGAVVWRPRTGREAGALAGDGAGSLVSVAAAAAALRRLEAEKAQVEASARTEHLRTILLDAVSHHFRSPLAGVLGSVTSILAQPPDGDPAARRELLLIIKDQTQRLGRYVENFLSVARLEAGAIEMNPTEVQVDDLIYDVWEGLGEAGAARRFLQVDIGPTQARADAKLLGQVFGNVLENAIKYSAEGTVVQVKGRRSPGMVTIDVIDQGCGVPQSSQGQIFERFYRNNASAPGLGLGLYITRSLMVMMGGSVEAANRGDGQTGLVVSISLPLVETP